MCAHIHTCIHTIAHIYIYIHTYIYIYTYMYIYIYIYIYIYTLFIYIYIFIHTHTCMYIYICIYTYWHIYNVSKTLSEFSAFRFFDDPKWPNPSCVAMETGSWSDKYYGVCPKMGRLLKPQFWHVLKGRKMMKHWNYGSPIFGQTHLFFFLHPLKNPENEQEKWAQMVAVAQNHFIGGFIHICFLSGQQNRIMIPRNYPK